MAFHSPSTDNVDNTPSSWEDACLSPYHAAQEDGRAQGRRDGAVAGMNQGYQWGQTTALSYGMEIGFMRGVVAVLEEWMNEEEMRESRTAKSLHSLRAALEDFPPPDVLLSETSASDPNRRVRSNSNTNAEETDVARKMEKAQTAFKLLIIQLGLPTLTLQRLMEDPTSITTRSTHSTKTEPFSTERDNTTTEW
jgi:hypothetical protein